MRASLESSLSAGSAGVAKKFVIAAIERVERASELLLAAHRADPRQALAAATDYLHLFGTTIAAWRLAISAFGSMADSSVDSERRQETALFFATYVLSETIALAAQIQHAIAASPDLPLALRTDPA
jgi:hypothetical protein